MSVYSFKVKAQDGSEVALSDYKSKVLLIVNTATGYREFERLHYKRALERLGLRAAIPPASAR